LILFTLMGISFGVALGAILPTSALLRRFSDTSIVTKLAVGGMASIAFQVVFVHAGFITR
jgi:hypothetical protein